MKSLVGLLGGSFDPIHRGHLHVANALLLGLPFSNIRFLPCYSPPHKGPLVATPAQRLTMLQLALDEIKQPQLTVDTQELNRNGVSYTIDTLRAIRQEDSTQAYAVIISSEAWRYFHTWRYWELIPTLAHLVIVDRPGYAFLDTSTPDVLKQLVADCHTTTVDDLLIHRAGKLLYCPLTDALPISSTAIREGLKEKKYDQVLLKLPSSVANYIMEQALYQ